jgi:hypothetical protein
MPELRTRDRSDESFTLPSPGERRAQRLCPGQSQTACCHQALSPGRCGAAVSRSGAFFSPAPSAFLRGDNWVLPRRSPVLKYAGAANEPSRVRTQPQRFTGLALWRGVSPISRANKSCLRGRWAEPQTEHHGREPERGVGPRPLLSNAIGARTLWRRGLSGRRVGPKPWT